VAPRQKKPQDRTQTAPKPVFPENQIISELPTRAPAQARQQLFADGKHAEIAGPLAKACPKTRLAISSQARRNLMWCTIHQAFLAEKMLEMNKQKQQEIKDFLG